MSKPSEKLIRFSDPKRDRNVWNGSLRPDIIRGWNAQILCIPDDISTNFRDTLDFSEFDHLIVEADLDERAILLDLERISHQLSMNHNRFISKISFQSKVVALSSDLDISLNTYFKYLSIKGPAIFSFMDFKPYQLKGSSRSRKFSITENSAPKYKFESKIFTDIEFVVGKRATDTADGDIAKITYSGTVILRPRKKFTLLQSIRIGQALEKIIYLMLGAHCGPQKFELRHKSKGPPVCSVFVSSRLYSENEVVSGIRRCWTLPKTKINFGDIFDNAIARYQKFETALEIILDARVRQDASDRFFRFVKALESIGRNIFPDGSEAPPTEIQQILDTIVNDPALTSFVQRRVLPIFSRKNNLGYSIEFAKNVFPFYPIIDLDKKTLTRLRNLEAHAATHVFSASESETMRYYSEILDFVCTSSILMFIGFSLDSIVLGLPMSRFSWFIKNE